MYFRKPNFQAYSHLLWLYNPVFVGPGRNPRRQILSQHDSYFSRMAEFEESLDIIEEAEEGLDGATEEEAEMTEEEAEEFKEEIAEAKENVTEMASDAKEFSKFAKFTEAIKSFGLFLVKTAAIGSIFFGVNVLLSKLVKRAQGDKESNKKKRAVVNAITALIQSESGKSKKLLDWLKQHQDDTIELDGIPVPLEAIFHKYLGPISDVSIIHYSLLQPIFDKLPFPF